MIDLTASPRLSDEEISSVMEVLRSGHLVQGEQVAAFEQEFAALVNGRPCVAVNSGTSALYLSLLALGIGHGDEVIVPAFTFGATAHAVALTGAQPVFADIDAETFCMDPAHAASLTGPRTAAIVPVHLFGHPAPMPSLLAVAATHGLAVVEDAAQSIGAALDDRPTGTFGDLGCFSFYPTKNMHTIEGGMIAAADETHAARLRLLRNQGMIRRYQYEVTGLNARMTDVSAALGRVQLTTLHARTQARRSNAARLTARLTTVTTPSHAAGVNHVFHQYVVRTRYRDALMRRLGDAGIGHAVHYPVPLHQTPAYTREICLPVSESMSQEVLSLPVHPDLSAADLTHIAEVVDGQ